MSIDLILDRTDARPNGRDRWRSACPACGGKNKSKLSIGTGDNGCVLLRCWAGCGIDDICKALGITVEELFPPRDASASPLKRRRMLTTAQALALLEADVGIAFVVCSDMRNGRAVSAATWTRFITAVAQIGELAAETRA